LSSPRPVDELQHWFANATREVNDLAFFLDGFPQILLAYMFHILHFAGLAWEALQHVRKVVEFLVYISLEEKKFPSVH
jgi:hypothetical protein